MSNEMKTKAVRKRQKELVENWGEDIRAEAEKLLPDNIKLPDSNAGNDENGPESNSPQT